jgi:hypothetical protein
MLKYIISLLIIYFIYIYDKSIIQNNKDATKNKYINFVIEKNLLIFIISIISLLIIWDNKNIKINISFTILLILLNLALWIRLSKINNYLNESEKLELQESFISSVAKPKYNYSYTSNESMKKFEGDFLNECYDNKLLIPGFEPIIKPEKIDAEDAKIRITTIELALNSDDMFSIQQENNKCIIANYIPHNLDLVNNNIV